MPTFRNYLSLIKFSHTIFAMPFAGIGFVMGWNRLRRHNLVDGSGVPEIFGVNGWGTQLLLVVGCMVFARTAAMAFNRYLDRHFDAKNPRTAIREIPSGIIAADHVLWFTVISSLLFMVCSYGINTLCFWLSPVALFVILGYSFTKRFTALCHLVLGLGLSLAPIGAYLALTARFDVLPVLVSLAVIGWVGGFDIIYALQDEEFDKAHDLYSIPVLMGKNKALMVSRTLHVFSALMVVAAGLLGGYHLFFWTGAAVFVGMLVYQHAIVSPHDLSRVNIAFMTANGLASVVFALFAIADMLY